MSARQQQHVHVHSSSELVGTICASTVVGRPLTVYQLQASRVLSGTKMPFSMTATQRKICKTDLHDNSERNPHSHSPANSKQRYHKSTGPDSLDKESAHHQNKEQQQRTGPYVAQHERHSWQFEWAPLARSLGTPLPHKITDPGEFGISGSFRIVGIDWKLRKQ